MNRSNTLRENCSVVWQRSLLRVALFCYCRKSCFCECDSSMPVARTDHAPTPTQYGCDDQLRGFRNPCCAYTRTRNLHACVVSAKECCRRSTCSGATNGTIAPADNCFSALQRSDVYDVAADSWSRATDPPLGLHSGCSVVYNDRLYIFGGKTAAGGGTGKVRASAPRLRMLAVVVAVIRYVALCLALCAGRLLWLW